MICTEWAHDIKTTHSTVQQGKAMQGTVQNHRHKNESTKPMNNSTDNNKEHILTVKEMLDAGGTQMLFVACPYGIARHKRQSEL